MFDDFDEEMARIEFENDELIFRKGNYNPFFVTHKKKEKEYKPIEFSEDDKILANLFGF